MKFKKARLLDELRQTTAEARARKAAELLGCEAVRRAVHQAAVEGQSGLRVRLPDWLDAVTNTPAARDLEAWAKAEGLRFEWERREATLSDGRRVTVVEPEISWAQPNAVPR